MRKRSLTLSGHQTSIALEPSFWDALEHIASAEGLALSQIITRIDEGRETANLSSAIRVYVLEWHRSRLKSQGIEL